VNVGAPWPDLDEAERRVRVMQTKLHQWATADPGRRFDDLFNLVYDPAFVVVAWSRVRGNKGARTAGVDGVVPRSVVFGAEALLGGLREDLKARRFVPQRVREKTIPKGNGKVRALGIPTTADRVVQASLKLVLEPIFEADFRPCSYGFRPKAPSSGRHRRDPLPRLAGSELRVGVRGRHRGVLRPDRPHGPHGPGATEGQRQACPGVGEGVPGSRCPLRGRRRPGPITGTPQGGILSPLLANIALSTLDEHFTRKWEVLGPKSTRGKRRRAGVPAMRLVRYADDFVVMVAGTSDDAEAVRDEVSGVLASMGLRLSEPKTRVCHIDEGFDFLGWRIQRGPWRSRAGKTAVYTYPSKKSLASIVGKVGRLTRRGQHRTLADLLRRLNPVLRGWCNYFRHGVSQRTFSYLDYFVFRRVFGWLRKRHLGLNTGTLVRRHLPGWKISDDGIDLFRPEAVAIVRYRYRGTKIPTPWASETTGPAAPAA
jgi:RNA-directed DNA polymerase